MAKYVFPAIFTKEECGYSVSFPDVDNCFTSGETLEEALYMAQDALCLTLYDLEERAQPIPHPSPISAVSVSSGAFVSLVRCDTVEYRRYFDNKAVKKTLTIPNWLNTLAERQNVNFSATLQKALIAELHLEV